MASTSLACYTLGVMDCDHRRLAVKYIRQQARQLARQLDGVRAAEDIEYVHRARVATRRLRASLAMFGQCFAPKRVKRWRKAIRRLTGSLGDARDRDVQIEFLCGACGAERQGVFPGHCPRAGAIGARPRTIAAAGGQGGGPHRGRRRFAKNPAGGRGSFSTSRARWPVPARSRGLRADQAARPGAIGRAVPVREQPGRPEDRVVTMPCGSR